MGAESEVDAPNASGRLTSFSFEGRGSEVAGMSIVNAAVRIRSRHFNGRQPSDLISIF